MSTAWLTNGNCLDELDEFLGNGAWHMERGMKGRAREKAVVFLIATADAYHILNSKEKRTVDALRRQLREISAKNVKDAEQRGIKKKNNFEC